MEKQIKSNWQKSANFILGVTVLAFALTSCTYINSKIKETSPNSNVAINDVKPKHTPNPSTSSPPTPGFERFAILDTSKFYQTQAFSVFDQSKGYVKDVDYNYVYLDGRFEKVHLYNTDVHFEIMEYASPEKASSSVKDRVAKAIPVEQSDKVKLPRCVGEKSDNDEFLGPEKIVKRFRHPNGSDIIVLHSGDFNMGDCKRGSNKEEDVIWADGAYVFIASALPMSRAKEDEPGSTGYGRAEEFALDYLAALGQTVTP